MAKMSVPVNAPSSEDVVYKETLYIPANKEIIEDLEIDKPVEVTLKGVIKSLDSRETNEDDDKYEFRIEVREVEVEATDKENVFTDMSEDED